MDYEAFWIPEASTAAEALAIGEQWLRAAEYPGQRLIVLNTAKIVDDVPPLAQVASRYTVVSPQMKDRPSGSGHAVLAPWVVGRALQLAEEFASSGGGLCLIASAPTPSEVADWLLRTQAMILAEQM